LTTLIGNSKAKRTLAAWVSGGRLPHAILVEGEPGSGRATFAKILAGVILCEADIARTDKDVHVDKNIHCETICPCGTCRHCVKVYKDIHPDFEIKRGGSGKRSFHADVVREIRTKAFIRPNEADSRVFLLLDAQNMSVQAQNALLKIIEEPPRSVFFILTCETRGQLLQTIQSRAATVTLEALDIRECEDYLREKFPGASQQEISAAAVGADGNIGRAQTLLTNESTKSEYEAARTALYALIKNDELSALEYFYAFERSREAFIHSLKLMRSIATSFLPGAVYDISASADRPALSQNRVFQIVDIIDDAISAAESNAGVPLLTLSLCSKIATN